MNQFELHQARIDREARAAIAAKTKNKTGSASKPATNQKPTSRAKTPEKKQPTKKSAR